MLPHASITVVPGVIGGVVTRRGGIRVEPDLDGVITLLDILHGGGIRDLDILVPGITLEVLAVPDFGGEFVVVVLVPVICIGGGVLVHAACHGIVCSRSPRSATPPCSWNPKHWLGFLLGK